MLITYVAPQFRAARSEAGLVLFSRELFKMFVGNLDMARMGNWLKVKKSMPVSYLVVHLLKSLPRLH